MLCANFFGTFFSYTFKGFATDGTYHAPLSDRLISVAGCLGAGLVNGTTRIVMGTFSDKYSFRFLLTIMMVVSLFNSTVCFWAANNPACFFICVLMNYFSLGGLFAIFPRTVIATFGK